MKLKNYYHRTSFEMAFLDGMDILRIKKYIGDVTNIICDYDNEIQLRSIEAVQSLHFMLGRLLEKSGG